MNVNVIIGVSPLPSNAASLTGQVVRHVEIYLVLFPLDLQILLQVSATELGLIVNHQLYV